jgi:hypothetical protein
MVKEAVVMGIAVISRSLKLRWMLRLGRDGHLNFIYSSPLARAQLVVALLTAPISTPTDSFLKFQDASALV